MKVKKLKKQVDQDYVLGCLETGLDETTQANQHLHYTLVSMLVDAYDQDITREAFCNLVVCSLQAKGSMVAASTLRMMRERYDAGVCDLAMINDSIIGNLEYANGFRADLAAQYKLVKECRGEEDTVS